MKSRPPPRTFAPQHLTRSLEALSTPSHSSRWTGTVKLVIGAADADDLGVDTQPEGTIVGEVSYKGHRYPAEIIAHCVWLYHRFPLSFREVEELMLVRGVIVTYETIRQWCAKFGPVYAAGLRRRQTPTRRQVASRRGVLDDQRPSSVSVAGRRPGRQRPRHPRPVAGATPRPPSGSSANSSRGSARLLGCWSPTSSEATQWRIGR